MNEAHNLQQAVERLQRSQRRIVRVAAALLIAAVAGVILVAQDRRTQPVTAPAFIVVRPDGTTAAVLGPNGLALSADGRTTRAQLSPGSLSLADASGREGVNLAANANGSSLDLRTPGSDATKPTGRVDARATPDGHASLRVTDNARESFAAGNPPPTRPGGSTPGTEDTRWGEARMLAATIRDALVAWCRARNGQLTGLVPAGQGFNLVDARERLGISLVTLAALQYFSAVDFTVWIDSVERGTFRIVVRGSERAGRHSPPGRLTVWQDGRTALEQDDHQD